LKTILRNNEEMRPFIEANTREKWTAVARGRFGVRFFVNFCIKISDEDDDKKTTNKTIKIYNKSNTRVTKSISVICSTRQSALSALCIIVVSL
jgi:hypothetical protein